MLEKNCWRPWQNHIYRISFLTSVTHNWGEVSSWVGYYMSSSSGWLNFRPDSGEGASSTSLADEHTYYHTQFANCSIFGRSRKYPCQLLLCININLPATDNILKRRLNLKWLPIVFNQTTPISRSTSQGYFERQLLLYLPATNTILKRRLNLQWPPRFLESVQTWRMSTLIT